MEIYLLNSGDARICRAYYGTVQLQLHTRVLPHACFIMEREIITCVPTNSHTCKTRVIPTQAVLTRVPYGILHRKVCKMVTSIRDTFV